MRIGLTFDLQTNAADARQAEFDPPRTIAALETALETLGHHVVRLGGAQDLLAHPTAVQTVDLVLNIAEGAHGRCREAWVPMLLEHWGVPFVGSGAASQALGLDKVMSKRLAQASGVSTPAFCVIDDPARCARASELTFPLIVKPRHEGSGLGIDPGAIVHDHASLQRRVEWVIARLNQPCVVEEFISFGELTVLLIGNQVPQALPAIQRPIDPVSRLSCHVAGVSSTDAWLSPLELTTELDATVGRMAATMFQALRCRDMARVDFRVDERGRLYFLEINPLPSFDPEGSVGLLAEYLGVTYAQMIGQILNAALLRLELPLTTTPQSSH